MSGTNGAPRHDWMIVAPWWLWPDPAATATGRLTHPELQKYETSKLVEEFMKDPERRLRWMDEDLVHVIQKAAPVPLGSNGKPRRFSELESVVDPRLIRKLFLDTHKRFYLVVCQLHCDAPGFPRANRAEACEVGFVVRRRHVLLPDGAGASAQPILKRIQKARSQVAVLDQELKLLGGGSSASSSSSPASVPRTSVVNQARTTAVAARRASTRALLALEQSRLEEWVTRFGVQPLLQGWFPDPDLEKVGEWQPVDAKPGSLSGEATFPMHPLIPPPNDATHAGRYGTIYFGLVPTGTGETDHGGSARFDDEQYYEVACYAIRHKTPLASGAPCKCPDGLFWSQPTVPYRIARHFDVVGTSRRPVTVQLPDVKELAANASPTLGVAFQKPVGSLNVKGNGSGGIASHSQSSTPEICFVSIPLVTIVAMFVFELFLPVVVLLFQLWFLLALKFCIPGEMSLAAGVTGEIGLDTPATTEAGLAAAVDASIDANFPTSGDAANDPALPAALKNDFAPIATANLEVAVAAAQTGTGPSTSDGVVYETELAHP